MNPWTIHADETNCKILFRKLEKIKSFQFSLNDQLSLSLTHSSRYCYQFNVIVSILKLEVLIKLSSIDPIFSSWLSPTFIYKIYYCYLKTKWSKIINLTKAASLGSLCIKSFFFSCVCWFVFSGRNISEN